MLIFSCHSERKRGIFLDVKTHGGLKMNHYRRFVSDDGPNLLLALLRALSASAVSSLLDRYNHRGSSHEIGVCLQPSTPAELPDDPGRPKVAAAATVDAVAAVEFD